MSQRATRFIQQALDPVANFDAGYRAGRASVLPAFPFGGSLIQDLERSVETAEEGNGKLRILPEPEPPAKPDQRDYIKFVALDGIEMRCSNIDCHHPARVITESRDGETLPYCKDCAHVEFPTWMAGI